ncbi:MAG: 16S rRNA (uracil(1498)-N(3))-methyltransferase [Elusimicrobia bacterium]|nr:16S rRNA (uracil(1498)-N(3))-methyltransferase [Elusimicrobiota bacterium]
MPPQYFIPPENIKNGFFLAEPSESHHISSVARNKKGNEIEIFDGAGNKYSAVIEDIKRNRVSGRIAGRIPFEKPGTRVILCFAVVSRKSMEFIFEHCTELGVSAFQPVLTERTQFKTDNWNARAEHLNRIIISACKQCGNPLLPELSAPRAFADLFDEFMPIFVAHCRGAVLKPARNLKSLKVFIGPEGGFSADELKLAEAKGAVFFSLGRHVLRSETACIAATALLTNLLEETG